MILVTNSLQVFFNLYPAYKKKKGGWTDKKFLVAKAQYYILLIYTGSAKFDVDRLKLLWINQEHALVLSGIELQ